MEKNGFNVGWVERFKANPVGLVQLVQKSP